MDLWRGELSWWNSTLLLMVLPFSRLFIKKIPWVSQNTDAITLLAHCWLFGYFGNCTNCCPLSWRSFCFRCVVVDQCFIHCHIARQKILFTSLEQLQTALWILDALLFLVEWEQTRHLLRKHPQRFVQNCKHTTFWYL